MLKSGLIIGGVMLVLAGITGAISFQICGPCLAVFAGLGAGYMAGMFDKPGLQNGAVRLGASAGAIGGVGALLGHLIGGGIGAALVGPEAAMQMAEQLGLPTSSGAGSEIGFWLGALGTSCCFGILAIGLMAGLGALGGMLWWSMTGKNQSGGMSTPPPSFSQ